MTLFIANMSHVVLLDDNGVPTAQAANGYTYTEPYTTGLFSMNGKFYALSNGGGPAPNYQTVDEWAADLSSHTPWGPHGTGVANTFGVQRGKGDAGDDNTAWISADWNDSTDTNNQYCLVQVDSSGNFIKFYQRTGSGGTFYTDTTGGAPFDLVCVLPDNTVALARSDEPYLYLMDPTTGSLKQAAITLPASPMDMCCDHNGHLAIASPYQNTHIYIYDTSNWTLLHDLTNNAEWLGGTTNTPPLGSFGFAFNAAETELIVYIEAYNVAGNSIYVYVIDASAWTIGAQQNSYNNSGFSDGTDFFMTRLKTPVATGGAPWVRIGRRSYERISGDKYASILSERIAGGQSYL